MILFIISLFFLTLLIGMPIGFCLGVTSFISFVFISGDTSLLSLLSQRLMAGIDSFPLMAVPFFVLAGRVMSTSGISQALVNLSRTLVGHIRGGLGHVNILVSIFFGGISGSAIADASSDCTILVPMMEKDGYDRPFCAAVTAASAVVAPIIPPSIIMVVYAYSMNVSVAGLFLGGVIPGLAIAISLMVITYLVSRKRGYPKREKMASLKEIWGAFKQAILALMTPIIIMGTMLAGIATPTEAAAIAVVYALAIAFFVMRTMTLQELRDVLVSSAVDTGGVFLIVGLATVFAWLVTTQQLPQRLADVVLSFTKNKYLIILLINALLLLVGMFLDSVPSVIILAPILAPIGTDVAGLHPIHFAIMMCINVTIGLITPPVGMVLYVTSGMLRLKLEVVSKELMPFIGAEIVVLLLVSYVPFISMTIPRWLGYA